MTPKEAKEALAHFPKGISQEIKLHAKRSISHYAVCIDKNHPEKAKCTFCGHDITLVNGKCNVIVKCPYCHKAISITKPWLFKNTYMESAYWVYYNKSLKYKGAIVARWGNVIRDAKPNDWKSYFHLKNTILAYYIFYPPGNKKESLMFEPYFWYSNSHDYYRSKTIYPLNVGISSSFGSGMPHVNFNSLKKAVANTPFQYSCFDMADCNNAFGGYVRWMNYYSKYPVIEKLCKVGLDNVVNRIVEIGNAHRAIDLRKNDLKKALGFKFKPEDAAKIRTIGNLIALKLWKDVIKKEPKITLSNIIDICGNDSYEVNKLRYIYNHTHSMTKIINHLDKWNDPEYSFYYRNVLYDYYDYIKDLDKLGRTEEHYLYPTNLEKAHEKLRKQIEIKANKELQDKIKKRKELLNKLSYQSNKFKTYPAPDTQSLIDEGNRLNHCVASYADRYASGETNIFFIRDIHRPDVPRLTMEIQKNRIIQVRGRNDRKPTNNEKAFLFEYQKIKHLK